MPRWLMLVLLLIFATHLVVFLRLSIRRGDGHYALVSATFALLVLSFSLRLWAPELELHGQKLYWDSRIAAWILAAMSFGNMLWRRRVRSRQEVQKAESGGQAE